MKLAIWHNLPSGGGKRALYDHVRGLKALGHDITVWCPTTADQDYLPVKSLVNEIVLPIGIKNWDSSYTGWRNWQQKISSAYIPGKLRAIAQHCKACADQINSGDFDLLFANSCQFVRVTPIAKYVRVPSILFLQEPYRWLYEALPEPPWAALPEKPVWQWGREDIVARIRDWMKVHWWRIQIREEVENARAFQKILVNSFYSRESVLRAYGLNSTVCYLSVDTELFKPLGHERERFVIGIGAIAPEKNLHFIIESLSLMTSPPALVWVGNVADPGYLRQVTALASKRRVKFLPKLRISDQEIVELLNRAMVFVYAPRLEPFGYAPLEANACETPVVAVAEGGVRETVQNGVNGVLVSHEPQAMADGIQSLLDQPDLARRLGKQGREVVLREWSFFAGIQRLDNQLRSCLSS